MSMITATSWVPRGCAAEFPEKYEFNEEEFERISKLAKLQLEDANDDLQEAREQESEIKHNSSTALRTNDEISSEVDDDLKEYDLEHYDDTDEGNETDNDEHGEEPMQKNGGASESRSASTTMGMGMFGNVKNLVYHASNDDDPYITLKDGEDSDSEREELQILPSDNLILAAKVEDDIPHLEVYVYEDEEDNLYVHHDLMLPAIPLTVEYINCPDGLSRDSSSQEAGSIRNLAAIGTMDPEIEIWDLDIVDAVYPFAVLGPSPSSASGAKRKKKKNKSSSQKLRPEYHTDAVLSLASNPAHRNLLASASADTTIKLWDLNTASPSGTNCASSYSYHTDKVCSLSWHPSESTALLSGSYDKTVAAADMRASDNSSSEGADGNRRKWTLESDIESVKWNPHNANTFFVATEAGMLHHFDARAPSKPLWTLSAHDAPVSAFDVNPHIPGYMATGSSDKTVKLWRMPDATSSGAPAAAAAGGSGSSAETGPSLITTKQPQSGRIFSLAFAPDQQVAFRLAVAGSKGGLQVWDTSTNAAVRRAFDSFSSVHGNDANGSRDKMVRLAQDDEKDDDDDEDQRRS